MRRLPLYFVVNVGPPKSNDGASAYSEGILGLVSSMLKNPYLLETIHISVINATHGIETIVKLSPLGEFFLPPIEIRESKRLDLVINYLMIDLGVNLTPTSIQSNGDWKPIIFIFSDQVDQEFSEFTLANWNNSWKDCSELVIVDQSNSPSLGKMLHLPGTIIGLEELRTSSRFFQFSSIRGGVLFRDSSTNPNFNVSLRRTPIVSPDTRCLFLILIDQSHSMLGEAITAANVGLESIWSFMTTNDHLRSNSSIYVVGSQNFNDQAIEFVSAGSNFKAQIPKCSHKQCYLAPALQHLLYELIPVWEYNDAPYSEIALIIISDGKFLDSGKLLNPLITAFNDKVAKIICFATGNTPDVDKLYVLTDKVHSLDIVDTSYLNQILW